MLRSNCSFQLLHRDNNPPLNNFRKKRDRRCSVTSFLSPIGKRDGEEKDSQSFPRESPRLGEESPLVPCIYSFFPTIFTGYCPLGQYRLQTHNALFSPVPPLSISPELVPGQMDSLQWFFSPFHLVSCTLISFSAATQTINQTPEYGLSQ